MLRDEKAKGDKQAAGEDGGEPNVVVRTDFRSTIIWLPDVKTGADGTATLRVVLGPQADRFEPRAVLGERKGAGDAARPVPALRSLGAYANVFASESFMDELAAAANADPVAFRLAHLKDPRAKAVIEKVAAMSGWKPGEKGDGRRGRGIAFSKYKNLACYVACVADVEIDDDGEGGGLRRQA